MEMDNKNQIERETRNLQMELNSLRAMDKTYAKLERAKRKVEEEFSAYKVSFIFTSVPQLFCNRILCFFKFLEDISPFCEPLIPLFLTSGDVCPGFQSQSGPLACNRILLTWCLFFLRGKINEGIISLNFKEQQKQSKTSRRFWVYFLGTITTVYFVMKSMGRKPGDTVYMP